MYPSHLSSDSFNFHFNNMYKYPNAWNSAGIWQGSRGCLEGETEKVWSLTFLLVSSAGWLLAGSQCTQCLTLCHLRAWRWSTSAALYPGLPCRWLPEGGVNWFLDPHIIWIKWILPCFTFHPTFPIHCLHLVVSNTHGISWFPYCLFFSLANETLSFNVLALPFSHHSVYWAFWLRTSLPSYFKCDHFVFYGVLRRGRGNVIF